MGLNNISVQLLAGKIQGSRILSLGYPDIRCKSLPYTPTKMVKRHERHGGGECPDTDEFFERMGALSVDYVDIVQAHGTEKIVDLNQPVELGEYDLVIDPGTIEHCFNIAQAMINAASAVKLGGSIYHMHPMTMVNHGFWNICPTMYHDFYQANGFEVEHVMEKDGKAYKMSKITGRMPSTGNECMNHALATRVKNQSFVYPIQHKYQ